MDRTVDELTRRVLADDMLGRDDGLALAELAQKDTHAVLYGAHQIRTARFAARVRFCSIVAGKLGGCTEDCKWCAQSGQNTLSDVVSGRTSVAEMVAAAARAAESQATGIGIVNSGRRPSEADLADVQAAAEAISAEPEVDIGVCASLGELSRGQASQLATAGVRMYNHNIETSRRMFARMVTTHTYDDRLRTLATARDAGLQLCCGGIFGLGEDWSDRIDMALTIRDEVRADTVPLNFLHAIPGTELAGAEPLRPMEILSVIAIFRFMLPHADLKVAGGREANLRSLQSWMFYAGATSCLIGDYLTTHGQSPADDLQMVSDLDLTVTDDLRRG